MSTPVSGVPINQSEIEWRLPYRGTIGMGCLILAESAVFIIFVVAYVYYLGKSLNGPTPSQVLELPILGTICLLSSSVTAHLAVSALRKGNLRSCTANLAGTVLLGLIFLCTTAREWYHLIHDEHLTIKTNLFGTTYYALVGLHATHVVIGLVLLFTAFVFALAGRVKEEHLEKLDVLSIYWHFVDAVWVVVFLVVYVLGR
ncbi:heme-copper oxidase subunit III [Granulicella sp. WH15]|uniref:cytochrome c oxidase subunit 3 n=1 Tax=Granulicella sp. WH15 TaxID=2602070 RepID=UPI0013669588|nr:cytochrome c oxidase subunit 3 [Granulicella sp. WH15]QHN03641.1 heme-copper oxidase subunit III [Granulicella sp. WH15]